MQAKNARSSAKFQYWRSASRGPTSRELKVLRHAARCGGIRVAFVAEGVSYTFVNGGSVRATYGEVDFTKLVSCGWLVADPISRALLPDQAPPQRYLAAPEFGA